LQLPRGRRPRQCSKPPGVLPRHRRLTPTPGFRHPGSRSGCRLRWNRKLLAAGTVCGLGRGRSYAGARVRHPRRVCNGRHDTGNVGGNGRLVAGHPRKLVDSLSRDPRDDRVRQGPGGGAIRARRRAPTSVLLRPEDASAVKTQSYPEDSTGIVAADASWDQSGLYAARVALNVFRKTRAGSGEAFEQNTRCSTMPCWLRATASGRVKDRMIRRPRRDCPFRTSQRWHVPETIARFLTRAQVESAKPWRRRCDHRAAVLQPGRYLSGRSSDGGGSGGTARPERSLEGMKKIVFNRWDPSPPEGVPRRPSRQRRASGTEACCSAAIPNLRALLRPRRASCVMYHGWADPLVKTDAGLIATSGSKTRWGRQRRARSRVLVPGHGHAGGGHRLCLTKSRRSISGSVGPSRRDQRRPLCGVGRRSHPGRCERNPASAATSAAAAPTMRATSVSGP